MPKHLLAVDAGTTGVTSILFDEGLRPLARAYREFPQHFPQPGWVEHFAGDILGAVDATLDEVLGSLAPTESPVALGITNQRETVFALDLESGEALGAGIVWQDRRTAERCEELARAGHAARVKERTGLVLDPYFSATKIEWLLRERAGVAEAADAGRVRFVTVDALIVHHLNRGALCATDPTNAARTMLFDLDAKKWSVEMCALFDIDPAWMPEVRPSAGGFGTARLAGDRRIPIGGIAGDQQAALFGQGCFDEGEFKNTYGTGCFLLLNTGERRVESAGGLLTTLAVARDGGPCYALEGSLFSAGVVVQWMRDQLGLIQSAAESEAIARSVEGTGGVTLVPAFAGLGAPYWDPDARAAILGLTRGTGRAEIVRAGLEGIAYQCAEVVELLREETGLAIDSLLVDGGAAANDFLMQFQADCAGLAVRRPANVETTARGAAALAGLHAGVWKDPGDAAALREGATEFGSTWNTERRRDMLEAWRDAVKRVRTKP